MQTENRLFDDIARVASGATSTLVNIRTELESMIKQRLERILTDMDLVPRDEFEAVKAVAAQARAEQELLEERVAELEASLNKNLPNKGEKRYKKPPKK
ncbi:MAG: pyrroline-5-carboxylate reductase [Rhodospirillaceae bacterium]|nr:pyrroline-5-carboxylate reductase [Rhodospirillaceae bacterium]|tara:strand:+ start:2007 stop:2303 length:297 start_codon:yes stop_codon:yes gene_type:complete